MDTRHSRTSDTLEPVADKTVYTISMTDSGGTIAPNAFLRTADLIQEVTTQFVAACNGDDRLLVIDLDEPKKEYGSTDEDTESDANAEADGRHPPTRRVVGGWQPFAGRNGESRWHVPL